jgi:hypothetical protein
MTKDELFALVKQVDPLHAKYRAVKRLRDEYAAWGDDFERRRKIAEKELESEVRP